MHCKFIIENFKLFMQFILLIYLPKHSNIPDNIHVITKISLIRDKL